MNARTLFILDGSQPMREFSGFMIDCDLNVQTSATPGIKAGSGGPKTVGKSFWTCNCEAVLEYCRVMFDIFGDNRRVGLAVAEGDTLNPILPKGCSSLWDENLSSSVQYIEALFPFTKRIVSSQSQKTIRHAFALKNGIKLLVEDLADNECGGRIIFLTRVGNSQALDRLKDAVIDICREYGERWPLVKGCSITIVHTNAVGAEPKMISQMPIELNDSGSLIFEATSAFSGKSLTTCLYSLAMKQHGLILTTIQGIPMKEEQGAGQSVNYDVELLHPAAVYHSLVSMPECSDFIGTSLREGVPLKMACMRWSTPKLSPTSDVQFRLHSLCASPLDMNSKPTQCLVQFLLMGRTVVLEPPKNIVAKNLTFSMMAVNGEIYLQAFTTARLPCEDAYEYKSVPDKVNMSHLTAIVRAGKLQRHTIGSFCSAASLTYLSRLTSCCPISLSDSLIANSQLVKPFAVALAESLKADTFPQCTHILEKLMSNEQRMDLPIQFPPNNRLRSKFQKAEAVFAMLWAEILSLLSSYTHISTKHRQLFEYACNLKPNVAALVNSKALSRESVFPHDETSTSSPLNLMQNFVPAPVALSRPVTSPTPLKKIRLSGGLTTVAEPSSFAATTASVNLHPVGESFLTMVTAQVANRRKPREFGRRLPEGKVAELYIGFSERASVPKGGTAVPME